MCSLVKWIIGCGGEWAGPGTGIASPRVGPPHKGQYVEIGGSGFCFLGLSAASAVTLQFTA